MLSTRGGLWQFHGGSFLDTVVRELEGSGAVFATTNVVKNGSNNLASALKIWTPNRVGGVSEPP
jgi:hypothetical protein